MKNKPNKRVLCNPGSIRIGLGSSSQAILMLAKVLARRRGMPPDLLPQEIGFDFRDSPNGGERLSLELDSVEAFGPGSFIPAHIPLDREALHTADRAGKLWCMSEDWPNELESTMDNQGASGRPYIGYTIANLNSKILRRTLDRKFRAIKDHHLHDKTLLTGAENTTLCCRAHVDIELSANGAMGGGLERFLKAIKASTRRNGVEVHVRIHILCRGNLPTHDTAQADLNEYNAIKLLLSRGIGTYVDLRTDLKLSVLYGSVWFACNRNPNGNLPDLVSLQAHEANCFDFLDHSPAGAMLRDRLPDVKDIRPGPDGMPRIAYSGSYACISWDHRRVQQYSKHKAVAVYAESMLAEGNGDSMLEETLAWCRHYNWVESEIENLLTGSLMRTDSSGESLSTILTASLRDRIGNVRASTSIGRIEDALESIGQDISANHEPAMESGAAELVERSLQALDVQLDRKMWSRHGLWNAQQFLIRCKGITDISAAYVATKQPELQANLASHEQIFAEVSEEAQLRSQRNWLIRAMQWPSAKTLAQTAKQAALAIASLQPQVLVCQVAAESLEKFGDELDRRISLFALAIQRLKELIQVAENNARAVVSKPTIATVPNGIELTDDDYLRDYFDEQLTEWGGPLKLADGINEILFAEHETPRFLMDAPAEECLEVLESASEELFRPDIEGRNVVSEFKRRYPDPAQQKAILAQQIRNSEGRFPVSGEIDCEVVWLKAANVREEYVPWLTEILTAVDSKPGKWEVAADPSDPDRISIFQFRGNIPLTLHLETLGVPDNEEGWARAINQAVDPSSAILVPPNPTRRQFRRVLAKAIANGQIAHDPEKGFFYTDSEGQSMPLGEDFESVRAVLSPLWDELVFMESTLHRSLVVAEEAVLDKLNSMYAALNSKGDKDPLLTLIDVQAVRECLKQAELLLPRLRRMRMPTAPEDLE